jgi:hypothetical protein
MIHGSLTKNNYIYEKNRDNFLKLWYQVESEIPRVFLEGVSDYYDGVLLCIAENQREAIPYLESAAKKFYEYPKYRTTFLSSDLNVLLLGKGMKSGSYCNDSITKVIYSGE